MHVHTCVYHRCIRAPEHGLHVKTWDVGSGNSIWFISGLHQSHGEKVRVRVCEMHYQVLNNEILLLYTCIIYMYMYIKCVYMYMCIHCACLRKVILAVSYGEYQQCGSCACMGIKGKR